MSRITQQDLLARFDGVIDRGGGSYYAKCPAHDDQSPSVSIKDTGETWLIHCFAGCSTDDVLAAVGLSFPKLYRDEWQAARRAATETVARDYKKRLRVDPVDRERLILEIAQADIAAGRDLTMEDRARVEVALQRLRGAA